MLRYLPEIVELTGYMSEPRHLRYVGLEISIHIHTPGVISFEEYRERFLKIK
ncbi:MAG: D-alanyl-D-alanine carboxypeptidase family protein [Ruminococcaceae bacterium]|nr:D-alanyl-D-alanine carboxypeptidase family protein [Oscillospiraceae bacterium]